MCYSIYLLLINSIDLGLLLWLKYFKTSGSLGKKTVHLAVSEAAMQLFSLALLDRVFLIYQTHKASLKV